MKKKVIFITQALWLGGIETALVNLLNHLDYEKYDVTCLITEDYQDMADQITSRCRLVVADRQHTVSFPKEYKYKQLFNLMEEPQQASSFRRLIWKIIELFSRATEMRLYAQYIKQQLGNEHFDTAVIYSDRVAEIAVRSISADRFLMFYHNADLDRAYHDIYGYQRSEKIIAVSEAQCDKLKRTRPQFASKMISIPNYIDVESTRKKAELETESPLFPDKGIHLVSCGRLAYQKGFDIAVKACAIIVRNGFEDLHWYILGMGPKKKELESMIREYGMENHFHLIGAKKNPFPYMKAADLYVQPSRTEGYSLSILEARVLACPTVATFSAAGEQMIDGETATLCEANAESIAAAICKHLKNPELSAKYKMELSKFRFDKVNEDIINKVEELL